MAACFSRIISIPFFTGLSIQSAVLSISASGGGVKGSMRSPSWKGLSALSAAESSAGGEVDLSLSATVDLESAAAPAAGVASDFGFEIESLLDPQPTAQARMTRGKAMAERRASDFITARIEGFAASMDLPPRARDSRQ